MAARIHKVYLIVNENLNIIVYEKEVKHVYYRVQRRDTSAVHLSVPVGISSSDLQSIIETNRANMQKLLEKVINDKSQTLRIPGARDVEILRERLARLTPELEMAMGVSVNKYSIRYMTSRWGSCSTGKRNISINATLGQLPPEFTEYVLIHELAHLIEPNHSPAFWKIVARFCSDWRKLRSQLKKYRF